MAVESIGLQALLKDADFKRGLNDYVRGVNRANTTTSSAAGKMTSAFGSIGKGLVNVGKLAATTLVAGVAAGATAIAGIGIASIKTAIDVESAFAGVIKTTDGLIDEFGNLTATGEDVFQGFRDLAKEVPIAVEELMAIGELGGQLGVAREDLLEFTEAIAAMGVTTNLSTEEAATGFAQIANIMGTVEEEGSDAFSKLGSSIVELGNNMATTEADILNFAQRIAGAGEIAGLSEADVLGIGAAFTSVGVQAEAGGTAVQKVLLAITEQVTTGGEDLERFAEVSGMTVDEFVKGWEENAAVVFTNFVEGLGDSGDDAIGILEDLGLQDQRLIRSFLSLAGAGDLLTSSIEMSSAAWDDNSALANEAAIRYATTESQLKIFKNTIRDIGITIGGPLLTGLNQLLDAAHPLIEHFAEIIEDFVGGFDFSGIFNFLDENILGTLEYIGYVIDTMGWGAMTEELWSGTTRLARVFANLLGISLEEGDRIADAFLGIMDFGGMIGSSIVNGFVSIQNWWEDHGKELFESLREWFEEDGQEAIGEFKDFFVDVWDIITEVIEKFSDFWDENGDQIIEIATAVGNFFMNNLLPALSAAWDTIKDVFLIALDIILGLLGVFIDIFTGDWEGAWEGVKQAAVDIWDGITTLFEGFLDTLEALIGGRVFGLLFNTGDSQTEVDDFKTAFESIPTSVNPVLSVSQTPETPGILSGIISSLTTINQGADADIPHTTLPEWGYQDRPRWSDYRPRLIRRWRSCWRNTWQEPTYRQLYAGHFCLW